MLKNYKYWAVEGIGNLLVRVRPWIIPRSYDWRHYIIKLTIPPQIALDLARSYAHQKWNLITVRIGNW